MAKKLYTQGKHTTQPGKPSLDNLNQDQEAALLDYKKANGPVWKDYLVQDLMRGYSTRCSAGDWHLLKPIGELPATWLIKLEV